MSIDLIMYGVVAAGLVVWLRSILGTRDGGDRPPVKPYVVDTTKSSDIKNLQGFAPDKSSAVPVDKIVELYENPTDVLSVVKAAQAGLQDIAKNDRTFDIYDFLGKAQDAFAIVIEAYAEGDRETLKALLRPSVYDPFDKAIIEREARGEFAETDIHVIKTSEVLEAWVEDKKAFIAIKFVAGETTVIRDADGAVISGHPNKVSDMIDVWVFNRDLKSSDPRWWISETRGGFEGDNDHVPNSD